MTLQEAHERDGYVVLTALFTTFAPGEKIPEGAWWENSKSCQPGTVTLIVKSETDRADWAAQWFTPGSREPGPSARFYRVVAE